MDISEVFNNYVAMVTGKYFCFEGRCGRKTFWLFVLINFVISSILGLIPGVGKILAGVFALAVFCPSLGITARRLHDTGKSGWMQLIALIRVVGVLILLFFCIPAGSPEENKFGAPDAQ